MEPGFDVPALVSAEGLEPDAEGVVVYSEFFGRMCWRDLVSEWDRGNEGVDVDELARHEFVDGHLFAVVSEVHRMVGFAFDVPELVAEGAAE